MQGSPDVARVLRGAQRLPLPHAQVLAAGRASAAELLCLMEYLGLAPCDLAALLEVREGSVRRWLKSTGVPPVEVRVELALLLDRTWEEVARVAAEGIEHGVVTVHATNAQLWAARPDLEPLPARWWRHVVARAVLEIPDVRIHWSPEPLSGPAGGR